jgi:tetratricopeptide (TPR) repeat protein
MLDEAEELYGSAKAGRSVLYGDTHLDTLACMQRLAELQERRGKIEDAVGNFRLLIEKFDEELGREHPSTLEACMQAAMILREECPPEALCISNGEDTLAAWQEDDEDDSERVRLEVESLYRRCLATYVLLRGERHRDTIDCCFSLATFLEKQRGAGGGPGNLAGERVRQRIVEVEAFYRRALMGNEALVGPTHALTLRVVLQLGDFLESQMRLREAETLYRRLVNRLESTPGEWHPDTCNAVNNLALLLAKQGRVVESEELYRRALAGLEAQRGSDHPETMNALWNLGLVLDRCGSGGNGIGMLTRHPADYDREAEEVLTQALEGFLRTKGSRHEDTREAVAVLAEVLRRRGKIDAVKAMFNNKPEWIRVRPIWL